MNIPDIIIAGIIVVCVIFALRAVIKNAKKGGCSCGDCSSCGGCGNKK